MSKPRHAHDHLFRIMRRSSLLLSVALATSMATGCDGGAQLTQVTVAGTWALKSVNGAAPPVTVQAANPKIDVTDGRLILTADAGFTTLTVERHTTSTGADNFSYTDNGYYVLIDTEITLQFNDGSNVVGDVSGNRITLKINGVTEVYEKQ